MSDGGGNLSADPLFVGGPDGRDARLLPGSPAIDAGTNGAVTAATDLGGNPRIADGDGNGTATVDMGAYEAPPPIIYVDDTASGSRTGADWPNAFTDLQDALGWATAGPAGGGQIWVATGVYTPGTTVSDTFRLVPGASLYGGFSGVPGTEGDFTARDWPAHPTVLSGDIAGDDVTNAFGILTDTTSIVGANSRHVVFANATAAQTPTAGTPITSSTRLDGFYITGGDADGAYIPDAGGGGLFCYGTGSECSPSLSNLWFAGNRAVFGGALYNRGYMGVSSPRLELVFFSGNAASNGGAMYNDGWTGESSPSLTTVGFRNNTATYGGAMMNYGVQGVASPSVANAAFQANAASYGGAVYSYSAGGESSPTFANVEFNANTADYGGALLNYGYGGISAPSVVNGTFAANTANVVGGAVDNEGGSLALINTILWHDDAPTGAEIANNDAGVVITTSLVEGGITGAGIDNAGTSTVTDGGGNLGVDPLFVRNPSPGTGDYGDLSLQAGSPAIDAGTNGAIKLATDLLGDPRISHGVVDMGAYEYVWPTFEVYLPLVIK